MRSLRAWRGERRLALAKETVDASCRAYRTQPGHEHAYVCRVADADTPLDSWRTHRMWETVRYRQERLPGAPNLDDGEIATAIEEEDATFRAMERAVVAGDIAECERRARDFATPTEDAKFNVALCGQAAKIIRADARLRAARAKL